MFWANTGPPPDATTDFGEMGPVIVVARCNARSDDGIPGVFEGVGAAVVATDARRPTGTVRTAWCAEPLELSATNAAPPATAIAVAAAHEARTIRRRRRCRVGRRCVRAWLSPRVFEGGGAGPGRRP
jgi:hypothetical protein